MLTFPTGYNLGLGPEGVHTLPKTTISSPRRTLPVALITILVRVYLSICVIAYSLHTLWETVVVLLVCQD